MSLLKGEEPEIMAIRTKQSPEPGAKVKRSARSQAEDKEYLRPRLKNLQAERDQAIKLARATYSKKLMTPTKRKLTLEYEVI
jgi:hypothetical protein